MKIRLVQLLLTLGASLSLESCLLGGDKNSSPVIMPLSVGNYWEYVDSTFSSTGAASGTTTRRTDIRGKIQIQYQGVSSEVFLLHNDNLPDSGDWLVGNEGDGQYLYGGKYGDSLFLHGKFLNMSLENGWTLSPYTESHGEFSFDSSVAAHAAVVPWTSTDSVFSTPAGIFHCHAQTVVIVIFGDTSSSTNFWVPNVGLVGSIYHNHGVITEKKVLRSYVAK